MVLQKFYFIIAEFFLNRIKCKTNLNVIKKLYVNGNHANFTCILLKYVRVQSLPEIIISSLLSCI